MVGFTGATRISSDRALRIGQLTGNRAGDDRCGSPADPSGQGLICGSRQPAEDLRCSAQNSGRRWPSLSPTLRAASSRVGCGAASQRWPAPGAGTGRCSRSDDRREQAPSGDEIGRNQSVLLKAGPAATIRSRPKMAWNRPALLHRSGLVHRRSPRRDTATAAPRETEEEKDMRVFVAPLRRPLGRRGRL